MSKNKSPTEVNKFLKDALKELDALTPKAEKKKEDKPAEPKVSPSADKSSKVTKKKVTKAKKVPVKNKVTKVAKPQREPLKIKRLDDEVTSNKIIMINPPPPVVQPAPKEDTPGKTKVVIKDGIVIVQLDE